MAVMSNTTKGKIGLRAAGAAAKNPGATSFVVKAGAPVAKGGARLGKTVAKRKANRRIEDIGRTARTVGETTLPTDRRPRSCSVGWSRRSPSALLPACS
jgi:hypothetical protein